METKIQHKIDFKTKPLGSLGKLEKIALQIGKIQNSTEPHIQNPTILVFAADHGLVEEGISPFPKEVTAQMVLNFLSGGAAINVFCKLNGLNLKVVDAGVDFDFIDNNKLIDAKMANGTKNSFKEPAMSIDLCKRTIQKGRELVQVEFINGCNTIGFGEMGIGNTSAAALLMHKYTGFPIEDCTGRGTGLDDDGLTHKLKVLKTVSQKYNPSDAIEILATFGGLEIAMMCGAMLEAKQNGMVILVDGFICTSALLAAHAIDANILDFSIFCHQSEEKGHELMHTYLKVEPIVNLGMRLGEGSGVAVTFPIIKASLAFLSEMASFEEAGVSNK